MKIEIETSAVNSDDYSFGYIVRVFLDGYTNKVYILSEDDINDIAYFNSITSHIKDLLIEDVRKEASHNRYQGSVKLYKYLSGLRNKRVQLQNELDKIFDEIDSVLEILRSEENE